MVAFVGGGGKTSAILRLSRELPELGWRVLATTTTKVGRSLASSLPSFLLRDTGSLDALREALGAGGRAFLAGEIGEDDKFTGIDPSTARGLLASLSLDALLVEADGSRQLPIKAPADHEPVLPPDTDLVVPVVGLDALGKRVDAGTVHRPELLAAIHGGEFVTPELVASLVVSNRGGLKSVPRTALVRPLLNKAYGAPRNAVDSVAAAVLASGDQRIDRVAVTDIMRAEFAYAARR